MAKAVVNPEAVLAPRPGDVEPTEEMLATFGVFASLKKSPAFAKFPGTCVLRYYRPGEVICRQGDAGGTAFYLLTAADIEGLAKKVAESNGAATREDASGNAAIRELQGLLQRLAKGGAAPATQPRRLATARLLVDVERRPQARRKSWLQSLWPIGNKQSPTAARPATIANDGPTDIDYNTRQAALYEGEVLGEMSCLTRQPRSATVVVDTECLVLEFLRNILEQMRKDATYSQQADAKYRERVLENHLRKLPLFASLSEKDFQVVREGVELVRLEPGKVIWDEGDQSDAVYVVRSGVVQVLQSFPWRITEQSISDWPKFIEALNATGATSPMTARVKAALPKDMQEQLGAGQIKQEGKEKGAEPLSDQELKEKGTAAAPAKAGPTKDVQALLAAAKAKKQAKAEGKEANDNSAERSAAPAQKEKGPAAAQAKAAPKKDLQALLDAAKVKKQAKEEGKEASGASAEPSPAPSLKEKATAATVELTAELKQKLVNALNEIAKSNALLSAKELASALTDPRMVRETATFTGKPTAWTGMQLRRATRVLYQILFPQIVSPAEPVGAARVMQYLGRGSIFGEIGVVQKVPRTATCVAYSHQRTDVDATEVELVRVPADTIYKLLGTSKQLRSEFDKLIVSRMKRSAVQSQAPVEAATESRQAEELGLLQGQNLMLIDLDRCTRCGDCVQACINTHEDGHSRLYLDGPRFGKYLVPSSCRQCRDPVCMIGCPVGSIQQGDDGEIQIREWCIGCGLCADQCPYDSIQMHDEALVPSGAPGWLWCDAATAAAGDGWHAANCKETHWRAASAPFLWGIDMVHAAMTHAPDSDTREPPTLLFRVHFYVDTANLDPTKRYRLQITSQGSSLEARINSQSLELTQDAAQKKRNHHVADISGKQLQAGDNVLAISVAAPGEFNAIVLDARLDTLAAESEDVEVKLVTERAVVCDQCSSLSGDRHACVYACPHDAALRVDSWDFLAAQMSQAVRAS